MASSAAQLDLVSLDSLHAAIYDQLRSLLSTAASGQPSSRAIEQLLSVARDAARDTIADFAESWNRESVGAVAERLPAEILVMCVRPAPFDVLISASHVSRKWRAVLLADRSLWASFLHAGRSDSSDRDDKRMLNQLAVMLDRSRPSPFVLRLPYPERGYYRYGDSLQTLLRSDFPRLQHYDGPFDLFERLDGYDTPMHHLRFLRLVTPKYSSARAIFHLPWDWATRIAPNIRQLVLEQPALSIPVGCNPMFSLTHLKISADLRPEYHRLFQCCPNLVSLELRDVENASILPPGPLPPSLVSVSLYALEGRGTEFGIPLEPWSAYEIQELTAFSAASLARPLEHFLSFCPGHLKIEMTRNRVEVTQSTPAGASIPDSQWCCVVYPFSWNGTNQLLALAGDCATRLTSLSVPMAHFASLFAAQLNAPQLVRLTFVLDAGSVDMHNVPSIPPSPMLYLTAPHLRDLVVYTPGDSFFVHGGTVYRAGADALRLHLRALVRFDAQRLQSVTVHGSRDLIAVLELPGLAHYAIEYAEDHGSA